MRLPMQLMQIHEGEESAAYRHPAAPVAEIDLHVGGICGLVARARSEQAICLRLLLA